MEHWLQTLQCMVYGEIRMNFRVILIAALASLVVSACAIKSTYEQFSDNMDIFTSGRYSLQEESNVEGENTYFYVADKRYLVSEEAFSEEIIRYHYRRKFMKEVENCFYYLDVDKVSQLIIGWGLDMDDISAKDLCGFAG